MTLSRLTPADASALAVRTLGMDPELLDVTSSEGLAASLRRAASFMCPTSPSRLIDTVLDAVRPLTGGVEVSRDEVAALLDLLIASGDLLELRQEEEGRSVRLVYLGPPSYIERAPGNYVLLGVRPFGGWLVETDLAPRVEYEGHTRILFIDATQADERLKGAGLRRIEPERWVASPREEPAADLMERLARRLDAANVAGQIADLLILDPATKVRYYKGRWRSPKPGDTGDFVARRPQAYGADLWGLVRLDDGRASRFLELPIENPLVPARDEAWRAQMAIDKIRDQPQQFTTEPVAHGDETVLRFYSPIPGFAERYLQLVGLALGAGAGSLFAFKVPTGTLPRVERLLTDKLWLKPEPKENK